MTTTRQTPSAFTTTATSPSSSTSLSLSSLLSSLLQHSQSWQQWVVDLLTLAAFVTLTVHVPGWWNPWRLTTAQWIAGSVFIRAGIVFYDHLVVGLIQVTNNKTNAHLLPTRTTGKPVRYVTLDTTSYVYLTINALLEWIFVQRLCHFLWHKDDIVPKAWQDLGIANTAGSACARSNRTSA